MIVVAGQWSRRHLTCPIDSSVGFFFPFGQWLMAGELKVVVGFFFGSIGTAGTAIIRFWVTYKMRQWEAKEKHLEGNWNTHVVFPVCPFISAPIDEDVSQ